MNQTNDDEQPGDGNGGEEDLTLWQVMGSALAAAFGVQSSKNRERDFSRGKPGQFIAIGVIFTLVFVLVMIGVVRLVLSTVGS
ncbi:MAG: DUF2970 domain-containing protein [Pseudomonadales bacterium]|jgi:hypothetical protein